MSGVVFRCIGRVRPIVLGYWQIADLSVCAGRDVFAEVATLAATEQFEAKTLGALMRQLSVRLATKEVA